MRNDTTNTDAPAARPPLRSYPNSIQRLARYFTTISADEKIADLADFLDRDRRIFAVCVVDKESRPQGIIQRDKLFLLLGKRFGWDLMGRRMVQEIAEEVPVYPGETNILGVSQFLSATLRDRAPEMGSSLIVLTGDGGKFTGMLSFQDLSNYFVDMTSRDIALASLLQERFLACADGIPDARIQVNAWSLPAMGVGGDFYFIKNLGAGRFFAALCDVSGKGIAASLVVSMVWGFLRADPLRAGLTRLISDLNTLIISTFHMEKYLTGFFMICDSTKKQILFADMGHAHNVILRNGAINTLEKARVNLPLGVETDIKPAAFRAQVKRGDALLIYTDGITEQDNPAGQEFGDQRLLELARRSLDKGENLETLLVPALEDFRKNTPQRDDMTCLFFRF
ncbi:MAG: SpoIIE family protein phosphatase [Spirochaetales bacterium]|jgi:sigma-B regulation protein RsbU (phosphoserine phosphatase)|nr:SpoIIE family protein phosphatase [Spirochaetales bacterium]